MSHKQTDQAGELEGFPFSRECPMQPPAEYDGLRARSYPAVRTVLASGRTAWLVSDYDSIRKVLSSPHVSSNLAHPGYPLQFEASTEVLEQMRPVMLAFDPPEHTAQRRLVAGEFTARRVRELRPRIEQIVDDQLDEMEASGREADLVDALALPVPSLVICELLGVPLGERAFFQSRTRQLVSLETVPAARQEAHEELMQYLSKLIRDLSKRIEGGSSASGGLLRRLVARNNDSGVLEHAQMVGLANVLLVGGHETTANMIALSVVCMLQHPEQLTRLLVKPERVGAVVDELMRYLSIADQVTSRVALEDIPLEGVTIPAGDGIIALTASGNHDSRVFENPHSFDVDRVSHSHLGFGHGIHQCIGQNLARAELEIALVRLFQRMPKLRLASPLEELPFKDPIGVYGLHQLPVEW